MQNNYSFNQLYVPTAGELKAQKAAINQENRKETELYFTPMQGESNFRNESHASEDSINRHDPVTEACLVAVESMCTMCSMLYMALLDKISRE